MKPLSYWLDTAPPFAGGAEGDLPARADAVVVGGGFCGLTAALAMARRGVSVVLVEAGRVVGEASGRNGGHCNNGLSHDFAGVRDRFGADRAREMYRAFDAGVDLVEEIVRREEIDCDFVRSGKLKLAARPAHAEGMRRSQEVLAREVDADTAYLSRQDLADEIGSDRYHGGVLYRKSANMHMGRYGVGLAMAAARAGARIFEGAPARAIERPAAGGFRVDTPRGSVRADRVFLATGASRSGPFGWIRRRIVPVGSFIVVTEPLGANRAAEAMPGRRNCTTSQHIGNYFRLTADDRLVFGGRARFAMSGPTSDMKSGEVLKRQLAEAFPQLAGVRIDYCWGGLVDMTQDRLPRSGTRDGIRYAMGYSGHGVQMSTFMGDLVGREFAGETVSDPWRDIDWPAVPLHFGTPWFLPFVGLYYRALDRMG